jgi:uncharacterized protein (DUF4213/DUF364 family)
MTVSKIDNNLELLRRDFSLSDLERLKEIDDTVKLLSEVGNLNPIVKDLLEKIQSNAGWLCEKIWALYALIETYQNELRFE